jgi:paired amphipathic helix protein Sin3a
LFKSIVANLVKEAQGSQRPDTNTDTPNFSSRSEFPAFGDRNTNVEHYYELLLESCERLFDNEIEPHAFEDQMRFMFGTKVPFQSHCLTAPEY